MKKLIALIFTSILFSCAFYSTCFCFDMNRIDYNAADSGLQNNVVQYDDSFPIISRYYNDNLGDFTQKYGFDNEVYAFGFYFTNTNNVEQIRYIICNKQGFQSRRYNYDGSLANNSWITGQIINGAEITQNLSATYLGNADITTLFKNMGGWYAYTGAIDIATFETYECNFTVYSSADVFLETLVNNNYDIPVTPPTIHDPYFYLKVTSPANTQNIEYTITWDTEDSWAQPEENFGIQYYVSKESQDGGDFVNSWANKKPINSTNQFPTPLTNIVASFTLGDLRDMYLFGGGFLDHNFYIYIRVVNLDTITPVNNKWFAFQVTKMYEINSYFGQTENDGTIGDKTSKSERNNGVMDYTDGRTGGDNTNQEGQRNQNGSSVSNTASGQGVTNYTPTNGQENGIDYGTSLNNLSSNLSGLVQSVSGLPNAFATLVSFMPAWVITIMAVSLGMIVVIGTIKLILR